MIADRMVKVAQEAWGKAEKAGEDRIDELWRAALEAADRAAWEPVETYQDQMSGVELVLVVDSVARTPSDVCRDPRWWPTNVCLAHYDADEDDPAWVGGDGERVFPSHWRRLPAAPEGAE